METQIKVVIGAALTVMVGIHLAWVATLVPGPLGPLLFILGVFTGTISLVMLLLAWLGYFRMQDWPY